MDLPSGKVVLLDPWILNPLSPNGQEILEGLTHVEMIVLTHGHFDHVGQTVEIARKTGATLIAPPELADAMIKYRNFPKENKVITARVGEKLSFFDGELEVEFTKAVHSAGLFDPASNTEVECGEPVGVITRFNQGTTIYHTIDTALFDEMRDIGDKETIDLYVVCIGGTFTMDPIEAAESVARVHPKAVMPAHYGAMPGEIFGTVDEFKAELSKLGLTQPVLVVNAGETISLPLSNSNAG